MLIFYLQLSMLIGVGFGSFMLGTVIDTEEMRSEIILICLFLGLVMTLAWPVLGFIAGIRYLNTWLQYYYTL
jgi:hypothetical protein